MGAEIGIATGRMHARGPVGAAQLTSFKYLVRGDGQLRTAEPIIFAGTAFHACSRMAGGCESGCSAGPSIRPMKAIFILPTWRTASSALTRSGGLSVRKTR